MKNLKSKLSTILLGASLIFGNLNKAKAQEVDYNFINNDQDSFPEKVYCIRKEKLNDKHIYFTGGVSAIYYSDKDNDNFYENIRVFNCKKFSYLIIEDFYIDKKTGLIEYSAEKYWMNAYNWNKNYSTEDYDKIIMKRELNKNLELTDKKYFPSLTIENLYNMGIGERVKKLINASKNEHSLKEMLRQERLFFK